MKLCFASESHNKFVMYFDGIRFISVGSIYLFCTVIYNLSWSKHVYTMTPLKHGYLNEIGVKQQENKWFCGTYPAFSVAVMDM